MKEFKKRLTEVDEILNHLDIDEYNKIPKEYIDIIKENKDNNYIWKYDETKKLKDQNVSDDTIAILSYINMEFLLNDKQKEFVNKLNFFNELKKQNSYKYDYNDIFKKDNKQSLNNNIQIGSVHNEGILHKIIKNITKIFKSKR